MFVLFQNLFIYLFYPGVVSDKEEGFLNETMDTFRRDPYEKLKKYIRASGYRLMDLFRDFDKDGSNTISRDEFERGIKVSTAFVMNVYLKLFWGIPTQIKKYVCIYAKKYNYIRNSCSFEKRTSPGLSYCIFACRIFLAQF